MDGFEEVGRQELGYRAGARLAGTTQAVRTNGEHAPAIPVAVSRLAEAVERHERVFRELVERLGNGGVIDVEPRPESGGKEQADPRPRCLLATQISDRAAQLEQLTRVVSDVMLRLQV